MILQNDIDLWSRVLGHCPLADRHPILVTQNYKSKCAVLQKFGVFTHAVISPSSFLMEPIHVSINPVLFCCFLEFHITEIQKAFVCGQLCLAITKSNGNPIASLKIVTSSATLLYFSYDSMTWVVCYNHLILAYALSVVFRVTST